MFMFRILQSLFKNEERNTLKINLFGLTSLKTKVLFMLSNFYNTKSYSTNLLLSNWYIWQVFHGKVLG